MSKRALRKETSLRRQFLLELSNGFWFTRPVKAEPRPYRRATRYDELQRKQKIRRRRRSAPIGRYRKLARLRRRRLADSRSHHHVEGVCQT